MEPRRKRLKYAYRRLNQWLRRKFFRFDSPWRRRLYDRKRELASKPLLTPDQDERLMAINWTLGSGYIYDPSPERWREFAQHYLRGER